jgi:hypothetical protein
MISEVQHSDGSVAIVRSLKEKPNGWESVPLSEEVSITWKYEGDLPDFDTKSNMDDLEEALDPLEAGGDTFLVFVVTTSGEREWIFYTRNYDDFMANLNDCLADKPEYPIAILHSHDPSWTYWQTFVERFTKKPA